MRLINIPGYDVEGEISTALGCTIYRGRRQRDGSPILIKAAADATDVGAVSERLEWEYEITSDLPAVGILPVEELVPFERGIALILEDTGASPLRAVYGNGRLETDTTLTVGVELATILGAVHRHGVVHKALHPSRVFVHPESGEVMLTGFEAASRLPNQKLRSGQPALSPEILAYMAPEQTGRMNRRVGRQADLYSLGILLYEMLTGRLPFEADDPLELIHAHIAREPVAPRAIQPDVPRVLSDIVVKLLAKAAEDRYQSALGLRADLEACVNGSVGADWTAGRKDVSDQIEIPEKLYGRARELDLLMRTFDRVAGGAAELLLVCGYSGVGKSALVNEIHQPIVRRRGYFVSGKFDQFQRNIPHSAVISAFQELTRQLLTESESQIATWRSRLQSALGKNGQVITSVIPEIELIIGPQPPVPELPPAETKNRFNLVFERFIKVFAQEEHPLVVFLDDLQWADSATLTLLQGLVTDRTLSHLLIIGAYRDNEVTTGHPLTHTLKELEAAGATLNQIRLTPLRLEHLLQFVADTLSCPTEKALRFAELVHEKTDGNPFFVIQFIKVLHSEELLTFDYAQGGWAYDLAGIRGMGITDNVVDLMVRKIGKLPENTQNIVKLAACIGNSFDLATLAIVRQVPPERAVAELREAVHSSLILTGSAVSVRLAEFRETSRITDPESATYRFLHDRVQQAAYALIPDDSKQIVHLQVGMLRWKHSDEATLDEHLFEIVGHLNIGASLIEEEEEKTRLAELNLRAGRKAKSSTAYKPALAYFEEGIQQLSDDAWTEQYELAFALNLERAEAAYLCGHFERAERELERLLERAISPLEKAEIYRIRIVQYENTSRFPEARDWGKTGLALFDIVFPEDEDERRKMLDAQMRAISALIGDRNIAELAALPTMTDEAMRISMKLLMTMWAPSYISGDMTLTALIAAKMVHLSLRYGNVEESAYGYVTYGATVGLRKGDYAASYDFGRLALEVNEGFDDLSARAKVNHMFSCYIGFWREPIASCFPYSREAHNAGLSSGDFIYSAYGVYHESWHALFRGQPLSEYYDHYGPYLDFMTRTKNQTFYDAHQQVLQLSQALQGRTERPCSLTGTGFDETVFLENYGPLGFFRSIYCITKLQLLYLLGDYEGAAKMADEASLLADKTEGMIWDAWRSFYRALTLSALYSSLDVDAREGAQKELDALCSQLRTWAENSPENFSHRHDLVFAEAASIRGESTIAMEAYERAIADAARYGFIQIEALANECYARFWLRRGNEDIAGLYLHAAQRCYEEWGASAKVEDLQTRFPHLLADSSPDAPDSHPLDTLDLTTVIRAAQVISGEVEQRRLLDRLLRIVMENAGAQRGCLLLEREGELRIEAEATGTEDEGTLGTATRADSGRGVAPSIIHYVARVGESVVLADATRDDRFSNDPYIQEQEPLSLLCTPILHQGKPIGMLYLENNLVRGAFTPDRIEVVGILASQAAISLENARLYEGMKQEVADRKSAEEELQRAHDNLELRVEERTEALSRANVHLQREIGERRKVEMELFEAKEAAEAANHAKSEFLASMSHELRTPLNAILGYAQILRRDEDLADSQRSGVGIIERSGEHLLTLINDILSLSKIEAGKREVDLTDFYLQPFLDDVVDIARVRAEQKGLSFVYEPMPALPLAVHSDERLLRQVLLNLLSNAAKFTERGGVVFRVEYTDTTASAPRLRFEVEDTGIGIRSDRLKEIFEPFRQVHRPDRLEEGTGLGLAISGKLMRLLGGTIEVRSTPGEGSAFEFELALPEQPIVDLIPEQRRITGYEGEVRKILVVDDKAENRAVVIGLLAPLGFELNEAADGQEAFERTLASPPDLVLMDLVMPVMDGFEATRHIRRSPALKSVVVLALSASVFEHNRQQSIDAGCHDFIPKPVKAPLLLEKLQEQLGLEWTYGETRPALAGESVTTAIDPKHYALISPPPATLRALHQLALTGDIQGMLTRLDEIEANSASFLPFVSEMRRLADEYDMQQISDIIGPYLDESDEH